MHLRLGQGRRWTAIVLMVGGLLAGSGALRAQVAAAPVVAAPGAGAWSELYRVAAPAAQELRGFGPVATEFAGYQSGTRRVWVQTFRCASPEQAGTLAGKFLADLGLSPRVTAVTLTVGTQALPAWTTGDGAVYLGAVNGAEARVLCSAQRTDLEAYLATRPELGAGAVAQAEYPVWLDRFDRYGWGCYGLDGYRNTHDWMTLAAKLDGKNELRDPKEDLDWMVKLQHRFEPHLDPAALGNSDGLIANADDDWSQKLAREAGLPVSFRLYGSAQSNYHAWALRRFGEYQNQPADFLIPHIGSYAVEMMLSWSAEDAHRYQAVKAMEMIKKYATEPNVMGWMHPYGEIQTGTWEYDHGDYGPYAQAGWHQYLQKEVGDLAAVSKLYDRTVPFGDWAQVPVPEFATFAGLDQQVLSLGGQWWARPEVALDQKIDAAWWALPPEERYAGLKDKWYEGAIDAKTWNLVAAPGGGGLPNKTSWTCTTWFRRSFALTPAQVAQGPVYLYWFPISHDAIHSGDHKRYHAVYLNGVKAGEIGQWGAVEVSKYLQAGDNHIALQLYGNLWQGRIYLSSAPPQVFPALSAGKNRLWLLWRQWLVAAPAHAVATVLEGMRTADPQRPIKIMAPIHMGPTHYLQLAQNYGVVPHFTGEGMWYFPWYKRYAYLYDTPGSSETSQPPVGSDPVCADQFASFRRVFLAGLNAHDPVFWTQTYSRSPALRAWWEAHQPVLHQLGRYDLAGPQVLIYRSNLLETNVLALSPYPPIGGSDRFIQSPWNWDIGRGTLQTIGQSYLYLDERGIADGKMSGYRVMVDCGNEIMPEEARDGIAAWVRGGGTFVALPFTGRSSLRQFDSWHIKELTGCGIGAQRPVGKGTVTIAAKQSVFTACAGQTFPDQGSSMDWVGNELNKYSIELQPGADCEVLATYDNGAPAVVKRRLGQGAVITFGSLFWRNCHDVQGLWWPKSPEPEVMADLLRGLGQVAPCETDGQMVWPQPYRSNNGLDWVTVLTSWNDDKEVSSALRLRLPAKPSALVSFGVDGEQELPFTWADGIATTKVVMPAREVKVVRALGVVPPGDAVSYWWNYQQRMWHALVKPTLDLAPYQTGKFADPTLDLRPDARFTNTAPADDKWRSPGFADDTWTKSPLSLFRFWGAEPGKPLWVRKSFTVPAAWRQQAGQIRVVSVLVGGKYFDGAGVWLNGVPLSQLGSGFADGHCEVDATKALREGENVLAWEFPGKQPVQAIQGEVYLYFRAAPLRSLPLGTGDQTIFIPREWQGKYRVMLYLEGERYAISQARINTHALARGRPYPQPAEYNLLAYLKYGEDNHLWINPGKKPEDVTISRIDLFPLDP